MDKKIFLVAFLAVMFLQFGLVSAEEISFNEKTPEIFHCQKISKDKCRLLENNLAVVFEKTDPKIDIEYIELLSTGGREITCYFNDCESFYKTEKCVFELGPIINSGSAKNINLRLKVSGAFKIDNESEPFTENIGDLEIIVQERSDVISLENFLDNVKNIMTSTEMNIKNSLFTIGACVIGDEEIEFGDKIRFYKKESEFLGSEKVSLQSYENNMSIADILDYLSIFIGLGPFYRINKFLQPYFYNGMSLIDVIRFGDSPIHRVMTDSIDRYCRLRDSLVRNFDNIFELVLLYSQEEKLSENFEKNIFDSRIEMKKISNYSARMVGNIGEPERSLIKINVNGFPLRDKGRVCGGGMVEIAYENIGKLGINRIEVLGPGKTASNSGVCDVTHYLYYEGGEGSWHGTTKEFICHVDNEPFDGMKYHVIVPIPSMDEIIYRITYYEDPGKCMIRQESIIVD